MIQIRDLEIDSVSQFVKLHLNLWQETYYSIFPESLYESRKKKESVRIEHIRRRIGHPDYHYVEVYDDFQLVGIMIVTTSLKEGLIDAIYLKSDYQRKGIGRLLLQKAEEIFREKEIKEYSIFVLVGIPSHEAFLHLGGRKGSREPISIHGKDYEEIEYVFEVTK